VDAFEVHRRLIEDYGRFTRSSVDIRDPAILAHVEAEQAKGRQWPDPWLSLTPNFEPGGTVEDLVAKEVLHPDAAVIFRRRSEQDPDGRTLTLHRHQTEAIAHAQAGASYVMTTGTGSGKSLGYLVPIVDDVLRAPGPGATRALIIYPMNALANSQFDEMRKYLGAGAAAGARAVTFGLYTGQESQAEREKILDVQRPDILLTNFVMLELMLTRPDERWRLLKLVSGLKYIVLDELHTYRGRQGADVALLVRRLAQAAGSAGIQVIGTSATMASGTFTEQQEQVAAIATEIFGRQVEPRHVIGETVARATPHRAPDPAQLAAAVDGQGPPGGYGEMIEHALSIWIEEAFGLAPDPDDPARWVRREPTTVKAAALKLAKAASRDVGACEQAIHRWLQAGTRTVDPLTGRRVFAFRLHQFVGKGDTVYASLERPSMRHLTSTYQVRVPGDPGKILLPLSFCRECGQEYAVVTRRRALDNTVRFAGRLDVDTDLDQTEDGYLFITEAGDDDAWPSNPARILERLPESWIVVDDRGQHVKDSMRPRVPVRVRVRADGMVVEQGDADGIEVAYIPGRFRFCLRCQVSHESARQSDFAKLASLDAEGRSTATTVLAASIMRSLTALAAQSQDAAARKLLTFVDNRQDASLQAGHFNDFVMVSLVRAALYKAAHDAGPGGLRHSELPARLYDAVGLAFADFAARPDLKPWQQDPAISALRKVLGYRAYLDLESGWRVTMPNLEQTGLLVVDYASLDQVAAEPDLWSPSAESNNALPADRWQDASLLLGRLNDGDRARIVRVLLNEMRRFLAVRAECLSSEGHEAIAALSSSHLKEPWTLPRNDRAPLLGIAWAGPRQGRGGERGHWYVSARGAFGQWLNREYFDAHLTVAERQDVIVRLMAAVCSANLIAQVGEDQGVAGYRLEEGCLVWRAGDGLAASVPEDPIRRTHQNEVRINAYFQEFYRDVAGELTGMHAKEHTAQVIAEQRKEREEAFKAGTLPLLYCSPTMELGVDIAALSTVAMRNVPPTPANYAQRSGRAGRAGQASLVVTYCASGNSHDQYYFRRSKRMVAGRVDPPRLDLGNQELVRAHVQAIWLAETGEDLHRSLTSLVDIDADGLPLKPDVRRALDSARAREQAERYGDRLVASIGTPVHQASWYASDWVARTVAGAVEEFDRALSRWREMYSTAITDRAAQDRIRVGANSTSKARRIAKSRFDELDQQLTLLRNDAGEHFQGDFYPYRYFASQGFLPGYAFPRLPLAAYIPGVRSSGKSFDDGDYLHRPRFLAITEFGPQALIYHEGYRYEVRRIQLPGGADNRVHLPTDEARTCAACGYHHERGTVELCEFCHARLPEDPERGLLRLTTVTAVRRQRISSDEEERQRAGFEVAVSYRFSTPERNAEARTGDGALLATLSYGDAASVRITNVGFRRRRNRNERGFLIDPVQGTWLRSQEADQALSEDDVADGVEENERSRYKQRVVPYVQDARNVLAFRLGTPATRPALISLQYALERAIERRYKLEDNELDSYLLPSTKDPAWILLVESAEGGAGSLKQLVDDPAALGQVARAALELCHFDPVTGADRGRAPLADDLAERGEDEQQPERCEQGCYDCLLGYNNQLFHQEINRHLIVEALCALRDGAMPQTGAGQQRASHAEQLLEACAQESERAFVRWLEARDYRLPSTAQRLVPDAEVRPDFIYEPSTAVFIDGSVHQRESVAGRDRAAEDRLDDVGWAVIRVSTDEASWADAARRHPDIFGPGREGRA
jgi:superfamily II DNA/RNA helicase/very-short-patch-repair endonuclease